MKSGFTLIELLVVVAIMGLMGTVSVGAYQQMQRGMEESGVVDNASKFVQLVAERAEIERRPTAIYYWNELVREETDDENLVVVGRAVAVRQRGRISRVVGNWLADEYGDLEQFDESGNFAEAPSKKIPARLYLFDDINDGLRYSEVSDTPQTYDGKADTGIEEVYLTTDPPDNKNNLVRGDSYSSYTKTENGKIIQYGYWITARKTAGSKWKVGSAYGLEFQSIELPHNYIFGSKYPTSPSSPVTGEGTIVFDSNKTSSKGGNSSGSSTIAIYVLKPGSSGSLTATSIGHTTTPNIQLNW